MPVMMPRIAERHQPEDDATSHWMVDDVFGLGRRVADPHQRRSSLEIGDIGRHARAHERDRRHTRSGDEKRGNEQQG